MITPQAHDSPQRFHLLNWWYRFTAPVEPSADASTLQRENARRGRMTSIMLLAVILIVIGVMPQAIFGANHSLLPGLLVGLAMSVIALFLNQRGYIIIAGILLLIQIMGGQSFTLISDPGGLSVANIPRFDLYILSTLASIYFFPPAFVFLVALANCVVMYCLVAFGPHEVAVGHLLKVDPYNIFFRPFALQFIVAIGTFLWAQSALKALKRADRAEEITRLQKALSEQDRTIIEEKQRLDESIQQIIDVHMRVANGDFNARVPVNQHNVLWSIAGNLNNLLKRVQHWRQEAHEYQRAQEAAHYINQQVVRARQQGQAPQIGRTGTFIDSIVLSLSQEPAPGPQIQTPQEQRPHPLTRARLVGPNND